MRPCLNVTFSLSSLPDPPSREREAPRRQPVPREHPLLARVDLVHDVLGRVRVPRGAGVGHDGRQHPLLDQGVLLDRVDVQPAANVPRDVAVEGPRAGVVGVVLQDDVGRVRRVGGALDELGVAALRVLRVGDDAVPGAETLGEHVEVVAVEMHGVGRDEGVVDYEADGGVGVEVVDCPVGRVGEVAGVGEGQDWVAGVGV